MKEKIQIILEITKTKMQHFCKWIIGIPAPVKIVLLLILAELMVLPFGMSSINLLNDKESSTILYPFTVLFSGILQVEFSFLYISCFLFFILPIVFALIVVSFFSKKISNKIIYISFFLSISIYLLLSVTGITTFANTARWFYNLDERIYIAFFSGLIVHILLVYFGIISLQMQDSTYIEYKKLLAEREQVEKEDLKKVNEKIKQQTIKTNTQEKKDFHNAIKDYITNLKKRNNKTHIKTKITIVILLTIITILSTFIYTDLNNYHRMLTQNVNTAGSNLAEQVSEIYYFSDGLHAKINAFIEGIKRTNTSSAFPFTRMDIITTSEKNPTFMEQVQVANNLPMFDVFSYTTAAGDVRKIPANEKQITPEDAFSYITHFENEYTRRSPIYRDDNKTCIYTYPILIRKKEGQRIFGFTVVTYLREVLDKPYFQVKVFIFLISIFFFYFSIIVTIFLADFIAKPIILLSGSIRQTADVFQDMLSGNAKIEANRLVFHDKIKTKDETKNLAIEINNIVSLMRGILPYVSFHTIQNAEKNINTRSENRELCFLFTDIRGFTTLCENMPAKNVIRILNHYLDLETKIIFENNGDVDKYVGDEMMAVFSGPKKEINACNAAIEIRRAMMHEQQEAVKLGKPTVSIGIGINSGQVVFGPVGSTTRKDFTSIGDTVNLAARLEGANKEYGSKSIISEAVYKKLNNNFICRELDFIAVKGKTEAVRIFEILQNRKTISNPDNIEKLENLKALFEKGLSCYRKRKWKEAEKYFKECVEKYNDTTSRVFLRRITHYEIIPPKKEWNGVFVMHAK